MSDTCTIVFSCFSKDLFSFDDKYWEHATHEGRVAMIETEVNYADRVWVAEDADWPVNVLFVGYHGRGWDYDAGAFHCLGDGHVWYVCTDSAGRYVVTADSDGVVALKDLQYLHSFVRTSKLVQGLFNQGE